MSSRQINLVMWTIVISVVTIGVGHKFFGPASMPDWTGQIASLVGGILLLALVVFVGRAGVRAALDKRVSTRTLIALTVVGLILSSGSSVFPILGLTVFLAIYGLPGLIALGLKQLAQRAKNPPKDRQ
jgi:hypothetical protein